MKIGFRITLLMVVMSLISIGTLGTVLISRAWNNTSKLSKDFTMSTGQYMVSEFQTLLNTKWQKVTTARTAMEQVYTVPPESRRSFINAMLNEMMIGDNQVVAVWSVWDYGALGDNDQAHIGTPGTDPRGRFIPSFFRTVTGTISIEPLEDIEISEYNLEPRGKVGRLSPIPTFTVL